ncbi:redox-regulated ATPase YchF [Candidatus Woesearchaeota archaeon]|nr:MAG: redox-regulated ATPase YchF [Candidatus Woesearchaeota archaeon]
MFVGCIGKPSTGKSTFFRAATLAEAEIANYPFTTISPNEGIAYVKVKCVDKDFGKKCNPRTGYCLNHNRFVPVRMLDVAGLVPGAHKGLGRGNQFLDDLRQADVLIHVVDAAGSTNEMGEPVEPGSYDPADDIKFLEVELDMWYFGLLKKVWDKLSRQVVQLQQQTGKAIAKQFSGLGGITEELVEECMENLNLVKKLHEWSEKELKNFASMLRKKTKPIIIACNKVDMPTGKANFDKLKEKFKDYILIACSAESELALREAAKHGLIEYIPGENNFKVLKEEELNEKQKSALDFIKKKILDVYGSTGVQQVLDKAVFELLKYIAVYPVANGKLEDKDGNILPDCLLVPENITALEFAYKVHSDIGNGFIKAIDLKTKQIIGKDHMLKNRDVIEIVSKK